MTRESTVYSVEYSYLFVYSRSASATNIGFSFLSVRPVPSIADLLPSPYKVLLLLVRSSHSRQTPVRQNP